MERCMGFAVIASDLWVLGSARSWEAGMQLAKEESHTHRFSGLARRLHRARHSACCTRK
jgi:hypothetical protein